MSRNDYQKRNELTSMMVGKNKKKYFMINKFNYLLLLCLLIMSRDMSLSSRNRFCLYR